MTGYFEEHSTPERYLAGNLALLRRPGLVSCTPGPADRASIPSAQIDGSASLRPPVRIAAGAIVEARRDGRARDGGLRRRARRRRTRASGASVVWDGARAEGDLDGVVVTPSGAIDAGP